MADEITLSPEEIAKLEERLQQLEEQKQKKILDQEISNLEGSVLTEPSLSDSILHSYDPFDFAIDTISVGATALGKMGGAALAKNAGPLTQFGAKALGALAGTAAYENTVGRFRPEGPPSAFGTITETGMNALVPYGGRAMKEALIPGDTAATKLMQSEAAQTGFEISKRINSSKPMMRQGKRLDPNNRMALESIQENASRGLTEVTGSQLGTFARDSNNIRGASINFHEKAPAVINDGIFDQASSISELATLAASRANEIGMARTSLVSSLDQKGTVIPTSKIYEALQPIRDLALRYTQSPDTLKFGNALNEKLKIWMTHINTGAMLNDAKELVVRPSDLLTLSELNNEYRRIALDEFNKTAIANGAIGNQPLSMEEKVAVDAFSKLGEIINNLLDKAHNKVNNLPEGTKAFSNLQDQYGGFKAVEDMAKFQAQNSAQGLSEKSLTNMTQTLGRAPPENAASPTAGPKENLLTAIENQYQALRGQPTETTRAYSTAVNRDTNLMQNIKDYRYLNQNPMEIPASNNMPIRSILIQGATNALGGAVAGTVNRATGMSQAQITGDAQAEALSNGRSLNDLLLQQVNPVPLLSRDFSQIKEDPNQASLLNAQAVMNGFIQPGQEKFMSEPQLKELHKMLIANSPQIAMPAPRNLNLVNNEFINPMEKDAVMREALTSDVATRAKVITSAWQNKYVPTPDPELKQTPGAAIEDLNSLLPEIPYPQADLMSESRQMSMPESPIDQLHKMMSTHANDWEH